MNKEIRRPKYFLFYRILCIALGGMIVVGSCMMILFLFTPGMREMLEGAGLTLPKAYVLFSTSVLFLIASIGLFKFKDAARKLIIIYMLWSFVQSLYYYFLGFSAIPFMSLPNLEAIILMVLVLELLIAIYFFRKDVKAYINA
jgi:hypothetical protein